MDAVENRAAPLLGSAVAGPVVLLRPPPWQVRPGLDTGAHDFADDAVVKPLLNLGRSGVEPHVAPNHAHQPPSLYFLDDLAQVFQGMGEGLLDEQVAACLSSRQRQFDMAICWGGDEGYSVAPLPYLVNGGRYSDSGLSGDRLANLGVWVEGHQLRAAQFAQVSQVPTADGAAAEDGYGWVSIHLLRMGVRGATDGFGILP